MRRLKELPEPPSGAESADIGKLDRVDDEISFDQQLLEELENQIAHRSGCGFEFDQLQNVRACVLDALCVVNRKLAGSAETGGEKAHNCPVCEYMKRINAKKAAESREPEKLNNAQKSAKEFREYYVPRSEELDMMFSCEQAEELMTKFAEHVALAESSLSSPPKCPKCGGSGIISKPHEFGNVYCYCIEEKK